MNVLTVFICVIPLCCWTLTDLDLLYPVDSARDRCMKNPGYPVKVDVWQRYNPCPFSERNSPPLKGFSEENQALRSFLNNAKIKPTLNNAKLGLQRLPDASMTTPLLTEFPAINPVKRRDQMLNHDPLLAEMEMPRSMNPIRVMSPFNPGNISTGQTCISENFTLPFKHPIFRETLISSVGAFKYSLCGFLRRSLDQFNSFLTEAIHHPPSRLFQGCCLRSFSELFFNNMLIFLSNFLSLSTYLLFYFPAELLFKCHFFFLRFPILLIVLFVLMIQIFIGIPFLMLFAYYLVVYPLFNLSSVFCSVMILFIGFLRNTCHFGVFSAIRTLFFQVKGILVAVTRASQGFSIFSIPSYILDSCEEKSRNIVEASSNEHSVTGPFGPGLMDISPNASIQYLHRYRKPFLAMSDSSELKKRRLVNRANVRKPSLKTCHCSKACHCRINMKQKYTNSTSERDLQAGCRCRKFCTRTSGRYDGVKDIPPS